MQFFQRSSPTDTVDSQNQDKKRMRSRENASSGDAAMIFWDDAVRGL
jgi:hypothetical protein